MKTILDLLHRMRGLSFVQRWNFHPYIKPQNVAEHSFWVVTYSMMLHDIEMNLGNYNLRRNEILQYAIFHDILESVTGDIPRLSKDIYARGAVDVDKKALNEVFDLKDPAFASLVRYWKDVSAGFYIKKEEKSIVKAADLLDVLVYCQYEKFMGNHMFDEILSETVFALRQLQLPSVNFLLDQSKFGEGISRPKRFSHL